MWSPHLITLHTRVSCVWFVSCRNWSPNYHQCAISGQVFIGWWISCKSSQFLSSQLIEKAGLEHWSAYLDLTLAWHPGHCILATLLQLIKTHTWRPLLSVAQGLLVSYVLLEYSQTASLTWTLINDLNSTLSLLSIPSHICVLLINFADLYLISDFVSWHLTKR